MKVLSLIIIVILVLIYLFECPLLLGTINDKAKNIIVEPQRTWISKYEVSKRDNIFNNINGEAYFRLRLKNWNLFQLKYVDLNNPSMLWKKDDQIRFLGIRHLPFSNFSLRWKMFQLSCYRMKNVIIVKYITKLKWKLLAPAFCLLLTFLR